MLFPLLFFASIGFCQIHHSNGLHGRSAFPCFVVGVVRVHMRRPPGQPACHENNGEFKPFAHMHGHDLDFSGLCFNLVDACIFMGLGRLLSQDVQAGGNPPEIQIFPVGKIFQVFKNLPAVGLFPVPPHLPRLTNEQARVFDHGLEKKVPFSSCGEPVPFEEYSFYRVRRGHLFIGKEFRKRHSEKGSEQRLFHRRIIPRIQDSMKKKADIHGLGRNKKTGFLIECMGYFSLCQFLFYEQGLGPGPN